MAGIPLPALNVRPPEQPDILGQYAKAVQLKSLLQAAPLQQQALQQQVQSGQLGLEQQQMQMRSQQAVMKAYMDAEGNWDKIPKLAAQYGAMPGDVSKLQATAMDVRSKTLDLITKQGDKALRDADLMQGAHDAIANAPAEQKPQLYQQQLVSLQNAGVDVSQVPPQYPGDQAFSVLGIGLRGHKQQLEDLAKQAGIRKTEAEAQKAEMEATAMKQYGGMTQAMADAKYRSLQQQLASSQQVSPDDKAWMKGYEKQKTLVPTTTIALQAPYKESARSDKSYQFHSSQLDKVGQPIEQAIQRLGRLQDTLAQNSPQADALVAPELLTVMAGGQGSGLRMNEAEISRIVGGRSNWESLQAAANKWRLDPKAARSITPPQQQQIRALVNEVQRKLLAKQNILDEARNGLINSDDPNEHRRIVAGARQKLTQIDQGGGVQQAQPDTKGRPPLSSFWR